MGEKVLVTGGAGYIGALLTPRLLELGHRVTVYDSLLYGARPLLGFSAHPRLGIVRGDIRDAAALARVVREHDWVLHLAAIVGYPACAADPARAVGINVEGTRTLLGCMTPSQRLVFASTGSTYGKVEGVCDERTPMAPLTLYGQTKAQGELLVAASGIPFTTLRFATVFGSSPRLRLDLLVNDFVYRAIHAKQIVLFEGHFRRTFLHATDAAAIYPFTMAHFEAMAGNVYNVGDARMNYTKREVALAIREQVDYFLYEADVGRDPDGRDYRVDFSGIEALGYRATVSLGDGIAELRKILSVLDEPNLLRNA